MPENHHFSVGSDESVSAGVPQRWLTLWERVPGDQPALLDAVFTSKSMDQSSHDGPSDAEGTGRLPQG
jgi:hypothetical protein